MRSSDEEVSLQAGDTVEFDIKIGKKRPEAVQVTGLNGVPIMNSIRNSVLRRSLAEQCTKNYSMKSKGSWKSDNISRHSSTENNSRSGTRRFRRHTLSPSESMRNSRQSINSRPSSSEGSGRNRRGSNFNGRAVSSNGRTRNRGSGRNQGTSRFRGTLSTNGGLWGSSNDIFYRDELFEPIDSYH